jgi:hypothetical protein
MKHLALLVRMVAGLLAVLVLVQAPERALASCGPLSPADQESQADAIVEGTVVDMTVIDIKTQVTIDIDRVLKGTPEQTVVLQASLPGEGVVGEVPFQEGWKYWRLYLREIEPGSGRYYTSTCFGSREIPAPA